MRGQPPRGRFHLPLVGDCLAELRTPGGRLGTGRANHMHANFDAMHVLPVSMSCQFIVLRPDLPCGPILTVHMQRIDPGTLWPLQEGGPDLATTCTTSYFLHTIL